MTRSFYDIRRLARCFSDVYALADGCNAKSVSSMIKYHHIFVLSVVLISARWVVEGEEGPVLPRRRPPRTSAHLPPIHPPHPSSPSAPPGPSTTWTSRASSRVQPARAAAHLQKSDPEGSPRAARSSARAAAANHPVIPRAHPPPLASPPTPHPPTAAA